MQLLVLQLPEHLVAHAMSAQFQDTAMKMVANAKASVTDKKAGLSDVVAMTILRGLGRL